LFFFALGFLTGWWLRPWGVLLLIGDLCSIVVVLLIILLVIIVVRFLLVCLISCFRHLVPTLGLDLSLVLGIVSLLLLLVVLSGLLAVVILSAGGLLLGVVLLVVGSVVSISVRSISLRSSFLVSLLTLLIGQSSICESCLISCSSIVATVVRLASV